MTQRCYEYFNCWQEDCVAYDLKGDEKECWELAGTLCPSHTLSERIGKDISKDEVCDVCFYKNQDKGKHPVNHKEAGGKE